MAPHVRAGARRWCLASGVLTCVLAAAPRVEACACGGGTSMPACEAFWGTSAVFAGRVVALFDGPPALFRSQFARIEVSEAFSGGPQKTVDVNAGGGDCTYSFKVGGEYLIFARTTPSGLATDKCMPTRPLSEAASDLRYLRALQRGDPPASRIVGDVTHLEYDAAALAVTVRRAWDALPIIAEGEGRVLTGRSNAAGHYEIDAPPGVYRVRADVPPGMYADVLGAVARIVDPRACAGIDIDLHYDGHVSGEVVTAHGDAVPYLSLDLVAAERVEAGWGGFRTRTDAFGRFEFQHIRPGAFAVSVSGTAAPMESGRAARRGVVLTAAGSSSMTTITVGPSQRVSLEPSVLPQGVRIVRFMGLVQDQSGKAVARAHVMVSSDADRPLRDGEAVLTDSVGRFAVSLPAGRYWVTVERYGDGPLRAVVGPIAEPPPLLVVVAEPVRIVRHVGCASRGRQPIAARRRARPAPRASARRPGGTRGAPIAASAARARESP